MTIKNIWKKRKLTIRIIKDRFLRVKRRNLAKQNKEAFEKYLSSLGLNKHSNIKNSEKVANDPEKLDRLSQSCIEEDLESKKDRSPGLEEEQKKIEEDRILQEEEKIRKMVQEKIESIVTLGKISYGIKSEEPKLILPVMQEQIIRTTTIDFEKRNHVFAPTASNQAKKRNASREKSQKSKNRDFVLTSPKFVETKKYFSDSLGTSRLSFMLADDTHWETSSAKNIKPVDYHNFLLPTESSNNKTSEIIIKKPYFRPFPVKQKQKKTRKIRFTSAKIQEVYESRVRSSETKERKKTWVPVARTFSSYIAGIDNPSYQAQKWSPLQFSLNLLDLNSKLKSSKTQEKPSERIESLSTLRSRKIGDSSMTQ